MLGEEVVLDVDKFAGLREAVSMICIVSRPTAFKYRCKNVSGDLSDITEVWEVPQQCLVCYSQVWTLKAQGRQRDDVWEF